jgi:AmiR/NasT family two-component response regulator
LRRAASRKEALDDGGRELVAGYAESLSIRATIKLALNMIMADNNCTSDDAYVSLCVQAGAAGTDLAVAAAALVTRAV